MATHHASNVASGFAVIRQLVADIEQATIAGLRGAALFGVAAVQETVPRAFDELYDSVGSEPRPDGANVFVDAPHALPVELGSRPHVVPLEALVRWVKLRGTQSLHGRVRSVDRKAVRGVRASLRALELTMRTDRGDSDFSPSDAPEQVARAIQATIARVGTRPRHFVEKALPTVDKAVVREVELQNRRVQVKP